MAYGTESYFSTKGIRCPVCYGETETLVKRPVGSIGPLLCYARCNENDCNFTERQRRDLLKKSIEEEKKKNG